MLQAVADIEGRDRKDLDEDQEDQAIGVDTPCQDGIAFPAYLQGHDRGDGVQDEEEEYDGDHVTKERHSEHPRRSVMSRPG